MEKELSELMPVWDADDEGLISVTGHYTIGFEVTKPEIFTLAAADYEAIHSTLLKAVRVLPKGTMLHFQDWYVRQSYEPERTEGRSFLEAAADRHFSGRTFLEHRAYAFLTLVPPESRPVSSATSGLVRPWPVSEDILSLETIQAFADAAGQWEAIAGSGHWRLRRLGVEDWWSGSRRSGLLERYCSLGEEDEATLRDIAFSGGDIRVGRKHCQLFSLADATHLPGSCAAGIRHDKYSTDGTPFVTGFSSPLGPLLDCNHIYNQYLYIGDTEATLKQMEARRLRLESLSKTSRGNAAARDAVNDFLNEAVREHRLPVKAHFNVLAWTEEAADWRRMKNLVGRGLMQLDVFSHEETVGAPQIWLAGIPGNAAELPVNETFDCFAEQALCLVNLETNYRSAPCGEGIRFCDRIAGKPVWVDLFDEPRSAGVASNMGVLCCGSSGTGKSMVVNHIVHTLHERGAHCLIVDIGGSYKGLCELVGGYYFTYEEKNPIRFNPFWLGGEELDTEKKEYMKSLLVALWKQEHEQFNRAEYTALSNALQGYYMMLKRQPEIYPCFDSFYEYLTSQYALQLRQEKVRDTDFDLDNFLYVLRPYYRGGEFDWLLNARENLDVLHQPFIVIEIERIREHVILFPVVALLLMDMFISKIRRLAGVRKLLVIDEAWKAIAKPAMADFLRYAVKTIRKLEGVPAFITQELDDLVSSPIIKDAIVSNCDIKILMDMRKFARKFDEIQKALGLSEKAKTILFSANKEDRELYIDIGGQRMKVLRNELSPEEYFAYTTEGRERVIVQEYAAQYGSMEKGIAALVAEMNKKY